MRGCIAVSARCYSVSQTLRPCAGAVAAATQVPIPLPVGPGVHDDDACPAGFGVLPAGGPSRDPPADRRVPGHRPAHPRQARPPARGALRRLRRRRPRGGGELRHERHRDPAAGARRRGQGGARPGQHVLRHRRRRHRRRRVASGSSTATRATMAVDPATLRGAIGPEHRRRHRRAHRRPRHARPSPSSARSATTTASGCSRTPPTPTARPHDGQMAGTFGVAGSFSFYPTKVMAGGEGGIIVTNDERIADEARIYRDQGKASFLTNLHTRLGYNWRMSEPHAAIALSQFGRLDEFIAHRQHVAALYDAALAVAAAHAARHPGHGALQLLQVHRLPARRRRPRRAQAAAAQGLRRRPVRRGLRHAAPPPAGVRAVGRRSAARRRAAVRPPRLPAGLGRHDRRRRGHRHRLRCASALERLLTTVIHVAADRRRHRRVRLHRLPRRRRPRRRRPPRPRARHRGRPQRADADWVRGRRASTRTRSPRPSRGTDAIFHLAAMADVNDIFAAPVESVALNIVGTVKRARGRPAGRRRPGHPGLARCGSTPRRPRPTSSTRPRRSSPRPTATST